MKSSVYKTQKQSLNIHFQKKYMDKYSFLRQKLSSQVGSRCSTKDSAAKKIRFSNKSQKSQMISFWTRNSNMQNNDLNNEKKFKMSIKKWNLINALKKQNMELHQNFEKAKTFLNIQCSLEKKSQQKEQINDHQQKIPIYFIPQQVYAMEEYQQIQNIRNYYNSLNKFQTKKQKLGIKQVSKTDIKLYQKSIHSIQKPKFILPHFNYKILSKLQKRFFLKVKTNDIIEVMDMVEKNPDLIDCTDERGYFAMDWIKRRNYKELEEYFEKKKYQFF